MQSNYINCYCTASIPSPNFMLLSLPQPPLLDSTWLAGYHFLFFLICVFLIVRKAIRGRQPLFLVLPFPPRYRQEWFPVLLLLVHLFTEKLKSRRVREERKPAGISLHLSLLCQFLSPPSLSFLILSDRTFPGSYILFYHSLHPYPSPVLSSSLILFALSLQDFLSLFICTLSFFLCFLIWSLSFTAQVRAHQCCCVAQNKLPFTLTWIKRVALKILGTKELMDFKCINAYCNIQKTLYLFFMGSFFSNMVQGITEKYFLSMKKPNV